jgi:hypothetical protein
MEKYSSSDVEPKKRNCHSPQSALAYLLLSVKRSVINKLHWQSSTKTCERMVSACRKLELVELKFLVLKNSSVSTRRLRENQRTCQGVPRKCEEGGGVWREV